MIEIKKDQKMWPEKELEETQQKLDELIKKD